MFYLILAILAPVAFILLLLRWVVFQIFSFLWNPFSYKSSDVIFFGAHWIDINNFSTCLNHYKPLVIFYTPLDCLAGKNGEEKYNKTHNF
jgi:hypothetical protein